MSENNILVGKVIKEIYLADDKKAIRFDLDNGEIIIARCDADCCSVTYIENIEDPENIIGNPVTSAEDIELNKDDGVAEDGDVLTFYGFKIKTIKGDCIVDYRNESNGYYGGWLSWPEESFYGGVNDQNVSKEEWRKVT